MTYLFYRETDSPLWAVAQVQADGATQVIETFDSAQKARKRALLLRQSSDGSPTQDRTTPMLQA